MSIRHWDGGEFEERHSEYWNLRGPFPRARFHCPLCGWRLIRIAGAIMDDEIGLVRRREVLPGIDEVTYEVECINGHRWWTRSRQWVRKARTWSPENPIFDYGAPLFDNAWDVEEPAADDEQAEF